jgi:hypothetical protein
VENPPDPPATLENSQLDCALGASNWHIPSSLLFAADGNHLSSKGLGDHDDVVLEDEGGNAAEAVDFVAGAGVVQSMLFDVQAWLATNKEAAREANEQALRIRGEAQQQAHVDRMQQFLDSGDPILMAEATPCGYLEERAWADINPGVLDEERLAMLSLRDALQGFVLRLQELLPRMQRMLWRFWTGCCRVEMEEGSGMDV